MVGRGDAPSFHNAKPRRLKRVATFVRYWFLDLDTASAEVIFAVCGNLFFRHHEPKGWLKIRSRLVFAESLKKRLKFYLDLREVVLLERPPLGAEPKPVILHLKERDGITLL